MAWGRYEGVAVPLYVLMEKVTGGTLEARMNEARRDGTVGLPVLRYLSDIAAALDSMHNPTQIGVDPYVHRDLKPANVRSASR